MTGTRMICLVLVIASLCGCSERINYVIDGDTVVALGHEKIRLLGIDCPELDCFAGVMAREYVVDYIKDKPIRIVRWKKDKYGRTLAWIFVDGVNLSEHLLTKGCRRWK